jgi:hypothetical protein
MLNYLKGYAEGIHRLKTDKAFALEVMKKYFKIDDPEVLDGSYIDASKVLDDLRLPPSTVQAVLDQKGIKDRKPEEFMDMSLVEELHASGFFKQLLGQ